MDTSSRELARRLNRSPKAVRNKASEIGVRALKRSHSFPKEPKRYSPSTDLAYLIGAVKGDGYIFQHRQKRGNCTNTAYCIRLTAIDSEFVTQVREVMAKLVGRHSKIHSLRQHYTSLSSGSRIFCVQICDKGLYNVLNQPFSKLEAYIKVYPADFLRGFFDAEGSAWIRSSKQPVVKYSNTDKKLLGYVRKLLVDLGIFPAKLYSEHYVYINGQRRQRPKTLYNLLIYRKASIRRFMRLVGSSIPRKRLVV